MTFVWGQVGKGRAAGKAGQNVVLIDVHVSGVLVTVLLGLMAAAGTTCLFTRSTRLEGGAWHGANLD